MYSTRHTCRCRCIEREDLDHDVLKDKTCARDIARCIQGMSTGQMHSKDAYIYETRGSLHLWNMTLITHIKRQDYHYTYESRPLYCTCHIVDIWSCRAIRLLITCYVDHKFIPSDIWSCRAIRLFITCVKRASHYIYCTTRSCVLVFEMRCCILQETRMCSGVWYRLQWQRHACRTHNMEKSHSWRHELLVCCIVSILTVLNVQQARLYLNYWLK